MILQPYKYFGLWLIANNKYGKAQHRSRPYMPRPCPGHAQANQGKKAVTMYSTIPLLLH